MWLPYTLDDFFLNVFKFLHSHGHPYPGQAGDVTPCPRTRWRRGRGGLKGGGDRPRAGAGRPSLAGRPRHLSVPEPGEQRAFSPPSRHSWSPHQRCRRPGSKGRAGRCERASALAPAGRSTRERSAEELGPVWEDCASQPCTEIAGAARSRASALSLDPASREVPGAPARPAGSCRTASSTPGTQGSGSLTQMRCGARLN